MQPLSTGAAPPHWTEIDWDRFIGNRLIEHRRIRYVDYGSGPVLVLLHGLAAGWQWWLENIPTLAERHRVIAVDLPGFGQSEPLPPPAEMATHARTVLRLLAQLEAEPATVVGHSMGGLVALAMATADPGRVRGLILVGAGGAPMTERRLAITLVVLRFFCAVLRRRAVLRALVAHSWLRRIVLIGGFRDPRIVSPELAAQIMPLFNAPGFVDAIAAAGRAVPNTVPESVTCPTLLIWGAYDRMAPVQGARELHARLPDSELTVFPDAGHTPLIECPARFNRAVLSFTASRGI
jgi:pimeloyl-ACP methyl ester carboxylesterase